MNPLSRFLRALEAYPQIDLTGFLSGQSLNSSRKKGIIKNMRTFLHTLRVLCYICAFISLFCGSSLIGGVEGTLPELFIDLGMAAFFAPR